MSHTEPQPRPSAAERELEKAARMALSYLLYKGPGAYTAGDTVDALVEALKPYNEEAERAAA